MALSESVDEMRASSFAFCKGGERLMPDSFHPMDLKPNPCKAQRQACAASDLPKLSNALPHFLEGILSVG